MIKNEDYFRNDMTRELIQLTMRNQMEQVKKKLNNLKIEQLSKNFFSSTTESPQRIILNEREFNQMGLVNEEEHLKKAVIKLNQAISEVLQQKKPAEKPKLIDELALPLENPKISGTVRFITRDGELCLKAQELKDIHNQYLKYFKGDRSKLPDTLGDLLEHAFSGDASENELSFFQKHTKETLEAFFKLVADPNKVENLTSKDALTYTHMAHYLGLRPLEALLNEKMTRGLLNSSFEETCTFINQVKKSSHVNRSLERHLDQIQAQMELLRDFKKMERSRWFRHNVIKEEELVNKVACFINKYPELGSFKNTLLCKLGGYSDKYTEYIFLKLYPHSPVIKEFLKDLREHHSLACDILSKLKDCDLKNLPYEIFGENKYFFLALVGYDGSTLQYASESLRDDPHVVEKAVSSSMIFFQQASERLKDDSTFVEKLIDKDKEALKYASARLRDDRDFVKHAIEKNPLSLEYASDRLRDDPEIVKLAVLKDPIAVMYASARLKDDSEFMKKCYFINHKTFDFAGHQLQNAFYLEEIRIEEQLRSMERSRWDQPNKKDKEILDSIVDFLRKVRGGKQEGQARNFVKNLTPQLVGNFSKKDLLSLKTKYPELFNEYEPLRNLFKEIKEHISLMENTLKLLTKGILPHQLPLGLLKTNRRFMLKALKINGLVLQFSCPRFKKDPELVIEAVKQNGLSLQFVHGILRDDVSLIKKAVRQNGLSLQYASYDLRSYLPIVKEAVKQNGLSLQYCNTGLRDLYLVEAAIKQNGLALQYAHASFKNNYYIVKEAIRQNGLALEYVDENLKNDPDIVMRAIRQNISALKFASQRIQKTPSLIPTFSYYDRIVNYIKRMFR